MARTPSEGGLSMMMTVPCPSSVFSRQLFSRYSRAVSVTNWLSPLARSMLLGVSVSVSDRRTTGKACRWLIAWYKQPFAVALPESGRQARLRVHVDDVHGLARAAEQYGQGGGRRGLGRSAFLVADGKHVHGLVLGLADRNSCGGNLL